MIRNTHVSSYFIIGCGGWSRRRRMGARRAAARVSSRLRATRRPAGRAPLGSTWRRAPPRSASTARAAPSSRTRGPRAPRSAGPVQVSSKHVTVCKGGSFIGEKQVLHKAESQRYFTSTIFTFTCYCHTSKPHYCRSCDPGWSSGAGASTCQQCPPGTAADEPGSSVCAKCEAGSLNKPHVRHTQQ